MGWVCWIEASSEYSSDDLVSPPSSNILMQISSREYIKQGVISKIHMSNAFDREIDELKQHMVDMIDEKKR